MYVHRFALSFSSAVHVFLLRLCCEDEETAEHLVNR